MLQSKVQPNSPGSLLHGASALPKKKTSAVPAPLNDDIQVCMDQSYEQNPSKSQQGTSLQYNLPGNETLDPKIENIRI